MILKHQASIFLFIGETGKQYKVIFTGQHTKLYADVYCEGKLIGKRGFGSGHANKTNAEYAIKEILGKT